MIRIFPLRLFLALAAAGPFAAALPADTPGAVRVLSDLPFLGAGRAEKMDLYLPEGYATGAGRPALVWIHGGGWKGGDKADAREKNVGGRLAAAGCAVASINYKLGARSWPANLLDCKNAVRFLRLYAGEYGIDPERISVGGGSAGGHLALMVGFTAGMADLDPGALYPGVSDAVRCVIDFYGPADLGARGPDEGGARDATAHLTASSLALFGASSGADEVLRRASPMAYVRASLPPILLVHGRDDTTVDHGQSLRLTRALEEHGVPHELILLDGVGHTFDLDHWKKRPLPRDLAPAVLAFLEKHAASPAP